MSMHGATRNYGTPLHGDASELSHHWHGIHNVKQEIARIRALGDFTMDELDRTIEEVLEALDLINDETTTENLLKAENLLREAATHLHQARVCKPSKEELRHLIIYNQELRKQVKGEVGPKQRFKL